MRNRFWVLLAALTVLAACRGVFAQSLSYSSGQNIAPAYEGWEQDADGSRYFVFGYMNRNWEEEIDVPVGPANGFNVGNPDQGQPTHFLPRRNRFVFRVKVPDGFKETDEMVWTLTTHGKTEKAYATLRPDYKIDNVVKMSETGALGAGSSTPEIRANQPPVVELENSGPRTVKVGEPLELWAIVTDDGVPKARGAGLAGAALTGPGASPAIDGRGAGRGGATGAGRQGRGRAARPGTDQADGARFGNRAMLPPARITVGKNNGLHLSWFEYRGPGSVTFDPPQVKVWEDTRAGANSPWAPLWQAPKIPPDGRIVVHATFAEPGTYVLRALADDGGLTNGQNVTVTVVAADRR